jgi:hypothetical protein
MTQGSDTTTAGALTLLPGYEEWLARLTMTYESVAHCCTYRLGDRAQAEAVAVEVISGLLARPRVFRFFGLPFSGRVAHLAELGIAHAGEPRPAGCLAWADVDAELRHLAPEDQEAFVASCVEGCEGEVLASALGCDQAAAARRRDEALASVAAIARHALGAAAGPAAEGAP